MIFQKKYVRRKRESKAPHVNLFKLWVLLSKECINLINKCALYSLIILFLLTCIGTDDISAFHDSYSNQLFPFVNITL